MSEIDISFRQPTVTHLLSLPAGANHPQHVMNSQNPTVNWEDPSMDPSGVIPMHEPTIVSPEEEDTQHMDLGEYSFSRAQSSNSKSGSSTSSGSPNPSVCSRCLQGISARIQPCLNSRTKRILTISSIVSLCFVIGTIIYVAIALNQLQSNYNEVVHTDTVKVSIDQLYISLLNADTSSRGYVITGLPSYLGPYNNSVDPTGNDYVWSYLYQISNLTTDNPVQIANCAELEPLIAGRLAQLAMIISDYQSSGFTAAQYDILTYSMSVMTNIRGILNNMTAEEASLLVQRQATFSNSIKTISIVLFVMLPCVVFIIIAGLLTGHNWDTKLLKRINNRLERLLEKAQEATKIKSRFLANMSHEIRTPMNGVLAMTQLLSSTALSEDQHDIVDTILSSAEAMMRLINDLLLFSKIQAGKFTLIPEWFYLPVFLTPLTEMFTIRARSKNIEYVTAVDANVPKYLFQDSGRLRQVLINLCDNSIKFTHRGHVKLHITLVEKSINMIETKITPPSMEKYSDARTSQQQLPEQGQTPGNTTAKDNTPKTPPALNNTGVSTDPISLRERYYIVFRVTDTGIGIASAAQKNIFEPFQQADNSTTRKYGGTGLGLSISSQLVKIMGSKLKLRSQPGWGSVFEFAIPITPEQLTYSSEMEAKDFKDEKHDDSKPGNSENDKKSQTELTRDLSNESMIIVEPRTKNLTIQEMPIIPETGPEDSSDLKTTHSASVSSSGTSSISGSAIRSIKWHDWFPEEYYDSNDRAEQKQIIETAPDQFNLIPLSIDRVMHSAPLPDISPTNRQKDQFTPIMIDVTPPALTRSFSYNITPSLISPVPVTDSASTSRKIAPNKAVFITPEGPRLQILVVEDNPVNQKVARRLLERDGHTVVVANHGQEGVDLWRNKPSEFDVVLMDLQMPVMDGMTATRRIRELEAIAAKNINIGSIDIDQRLQETITRLSLSTYSGHIPIIAVTASALEEDVKKCMEGGFDGIIHKPIDIRLLSKSMGELIAQKMERLATVDEKKKT